VNKPTLLVIGPTPPPHHGMTTFTLALLGSATLRARFRLVHMETADRRSHENMGRLDAHNVMLGLRHAAVLAWLLARHRPDLVYLGVSQNRWAYVRDAVFMTLCRLARVRIFTHLHGGGFRAFYEGSGRPMRWLIRRTSWWLAGAGVLGEGLRWIYEELVPEDRIHVVANGVADLFPEGAPERAGTRPPRITYLGTLIRSKGFPDLLRVMARLRAAGVEATLVLAGPWNSEEERGEAEAAVARDGLGDAVEMAGVVDGEAKRRLLADAAIFVLPTRYPPEGQPLSILEAMSAGLPVVSTPRAAIPDMLDHGVTGLMVPEGDDAALEAALRRLVESPSERAAMGAAGRAKYLKGFTEEKMIERLSAVMDTVLEGAS
jgi:glycosyltransferase involved in cell wall biosynthesis